MLDYLVESIPSVENEILYVYPGVAAKEMPVTSTHPPIAVNYELPSIVGGYTFAAGLELDVASTETLTFEVKSDPTI